MDAMHPDALLAALLEKSSRSERRDTLRRIHALCARRHGEGVTDFKLAAVGRECEAAGILNARILYNARSGDYKTLIDAWGAYAGGAARKQGGPHVLAHIADPHAREDVAAIVARCNQLIQKLATAEAHIVALREAAAGRERIDAEPAAQPRGRPLKNATEWVVQPGEWLALKEAVSARFLARQGWRMGPQGEIVNERGELVLGTGYVQAVRKLLAIQARKKERGE